MFQKTLESRITGNYQSGIKEFFKEFNNTVFFLVVIAASPAA